MAPPVFICCSVGAEPTLDTPIKALRNEGQEVEVIAGFEEDARAFGRVLDANPGPGLYVVVQANGLDQGVVRQLEGMFNARRGRDHQLAVVTLDASSAMDVLPHIRRALEGQEVRPPSPRKRSSGRWSAGKRPLDPDALARRLNAEMENAEAALTRSSQHRVPPANVTAAGASPSPAAEPAKDPPLAAPSPPAAAVDAEGFDVDISLSDTPGRRPRWLWPVVGFAGAASVVGLAFAMGGDDPPPRPAPPETPAVAASVPMAPAPEPDEAPASGTSGPEADGNEVDEAPVDLDEPSYREREQVVIANAIARGKVHALDRLLWTRSHPNPVSYAEAATLCGELLPGGVGHFRLPSGKEVKKLRRARMLEPGTYWSATPSEEGSDMQWVLDTSDVKLQKLSRIGGLARAVCVRRRKIVDPAG